VSRLRRVLCNQLPDVPSLRKRDVDRALAVHGQASSARDPRCPDAAAKQPDDPPETVRQLIIVAGDRAHLYEHLKRGFAGNGTVRVLLNRRVIARRARSGPCETQRRQADRRMPSKVDALLRAIGWAIVPLGGP